MKVLITAINSFVGNSLGAYLARQGHEVSGTIRRARLGRTHIPYAGKLFAFDLGEPFNGRMLDDIDILVHTANDFSAGAGERNVTGTIALSQAAKSRGFSRQIFISSYSANQAARTEYGQTKFVLERFFRTNGGVSVRPGLVLGRGSVFWRIVRIIKLLPVIAVLDGGVGRLPIVGIKELNEALGKIITLDRPRTLYNLFNEDLVTLRELIDAIVKILGKKRLLIPVSSEMLIKPLQVFNRLGISLPIDVNNVRAFVVNQGTQYPSDLGDLLQEKAPSFRDTLKVVLL